MTVKNRQSCFILNVPFLDLTDATLQCWLLSTGCQNCIKTIGNMIHWNLLTLNFQGFKSTLEKKSPTVLMQYLVRPLWFYNTLSRSSALLHENGPWKSGWWLKVLLKGRLINAMLTPQNLMAEICCWVVYWHKLMREASAILAFYWLVHYCILYIL